jgi:hypothetical protein
MDVKLASTYGKYIFSLFLSFLVETPVLDLQSEEVGEKRCLLKQQEKKVNTQLGN